MKISFFKPETITGNFKCTIHQNGKLGFSRNAINKMNIDVNKYVKIGINEEDLSDKNLYMFLQDNKDEETFKINKAGHYYYLNTKFLFDKLKIDYNRNKIIYDLQEIVINGENYFKLNKREIPRKKTKEKKEYS